MNGFVAAGSSVFTFLLSIVNPLILSNYGVRQGSKYVIMEYLV